LDFNFLCGGWCWRNDAISIVVGLIPRTGHVLKPQSCSLNCAHEQVIQSHNAAGGTVPVISMAVDEKWQRQQNLRSPAAVK